MALLIDNLAGHIATTDPHTLIEGMDTGQLVTRGLTLRNMDTVQRDFILQLVYSDDRLEEEPIERVDDFVAARDIWTFGSLGAVWFIKPGQRIEIVLDTVPTLPMHYIIDFAIST